MLPIVAFDRAIAFGTPCRLPDIRTTSAASMAMSVPEPMARPTSASARAGASLMPSPTKATLPYLALRRRTASTLPSGRTSATTSSMPSRAAMAPAVRALSPVIIATLRSSACRALIGSATAMTAASLPSMAA
ncbi:hypothetical protein D3C85_1180140 [compost metagenome]